MPDTRQVRRTPRSRSSCPRSSAASPLARRPREEVAGLTGERWLAWLEATLPGLGASARTALLDAPYARRCRFDVARALAACEHWVRRA